MLLICHLAKSMIDVHKGVQRACIELRDIAGHMKALRKRMEEEERVSGCLYFEIGWEN